MTYILSKEVKKDLEGITEAYITRVKKCSDSLKTTNHRLDSFPSKNSWILIGLLCPLNLDASTQKKSQGVVGGGWKIGTSLWWHILLPTCFEGLWRRKFYLWKYLDIVVIYTEGGRLYSAESHILLLEHKYPPSLFLKFSCFYAYLRLG